nr:hypothetical protein [Tanacetum cinerariifolium]
GPTYEVMKGSCKSLIDLEYHLEEVYKATTDQLDWVNPEGQQYPHNLLQPLPLIPDNRGRRVIPFAHFIKNDLEYLWGGASSRKYTTSVTKTKGADYGHIKWIEDLVPRTMWIHEPIDYDKHALWGVSHWGRKRQQFYSFAVNRESARDVYSKRRIIALYKFKEGDFKRLRIQDIEDILLLLVQGKLSKLTIKERFAFNVSLRMFTRSIVIQRRVEDLQLGVESYQKRLNLTKPDTYRSDLKRREADGTLTDVRAALDDRLKGIRMRGPRDVEKERSQSQQALHRRKLPGALTTFKMEEPSHPEFEIGADDQPIVEPSQHPEWFSQQKKPPTLDRDWNKIFPATHRSIQPWISELAKLSDCRSSFNELMDTFVDFSNFLMNRLNMDTLTLELLAGSTYELMKGSCKSLVELEFFLEEVYKATTDQLDWVNPEGQQYPHNLLKPLPLIPNNRGRRVILFDYFINNDVEYLHGGALSRKYITSVTKTKASDYGHIKWIKDLFYGFAVNRESTRDVYSKRRIIVVIELKIVEWHNYKHLDWIMVRRDDDKLYKFKEGDFKRLRIQDIEDMLLLLVQGKLTNLTVEERFAFNKKLNLTKPDTYRSDLKRKEANIAYSNPRGFIYQNKDKHNRLMRINELHKFSDGTLTNVRTALDDRLKGIRMKYLPQSIWRKSDKDRAVAMIQAIDKKLKTSRIMRSLERFVGGRLYERDFRMLQRTI